VAIQEPATLFMVEGVVAIQEPATLFMVEGVVAIQEPATLFNDENHLKGQLKFKLDFSHRYEPPLL